MDAAAACLGATADGEALRELGGLSRFEARVRRLDALVADVCSEQGLRWAERGSHDAALLALPAMARRVVAGKLTPRQLSSWAHSEWSHDAAGVALELAELDDEYDDAEMGGRSMDGLTVDDVLAQIKSLAAGLAQQEW